MSDQVEGVGQPPRRTQRSAAERATAAPGGRLALLEPMLLCALAIRPAHGYELRRAIEDLTEGIITVDLPGLYRRLRRLESEGLVWSTWGAGGPGPQRRVYTLTREGHDLLSDWQGFLVRQHRACHLASSAIGTVLNLWATDPDRFPEADAPPAQERA